MKLPARPWFLAVLVACMPSAVRAAAVDLGHGLLYYRVHELPAQLPTSNPGRPSPCVLDLRFAKAEPAGVSALLSWVKFNASARTPVFVLENRETSPALVSAFSGNESLGIILLAPASDNLLPDIPVEVPPQMDRRAYDAVEKGLSVTSLLVDNPDKPRIDEAYLEKEHLADSDAPDIETDKPSPPSPLVDLMLQRAVQVYRGLAALKKA